MKGVELWVGLGLTGVILCFHGIRCARAGPLWRDEAAAVGLATMPSARDVVHYFPHEAFPLLFPATVRTVAAVSEDRDAGWRLFGLLVGSGIVGVLWLDLWLLRRGVPLFALALLGFNGAFIQWGDAIRGYGLGTLFILLTLGLVWRIVERPSPWRFAGATLAAVASVQFLFHNPALVLAICLGAMAVAVRRGAMRQAALVLLSGVAAAASLLPYWSLLRHGRGWDVVVRTPVTVGGLVHKLGETLSVSGWSNTWIWALLFFLAVGICVAGQVRRTTVPDKAQDLQLFCGIALVMAVVGHFCFLRILSYVTRPWYYLALMGFVAILLDLVFDTLPPRRAVRSARVVLVLVMAVTSLPLLWDQIRVRQSNADLIAQKLGREAGPDDFIVVVPWFMGISFARYYRGTTGWMTLPPMDFHRFHRFDLLQAQMAVPDQEEPIRPLLEKITETLKNDHRVWVVGHLVTAMPDPAAAKLATDDQQGAQANADIAAWSIKVGAQLRAAARHVETVRVDTEGPENPLETLTLSVFRGWAPAP